MKQTKFLFLSLLLSAFIIGCSDDDDNNNNNDGNFVVLQGNLETQTLTKNKKYLVRGQVFVRDGKTVTIQPGTIIFGEKRTKGTLIVDRGGKMIAEGTASEPIVMTSNQSPGDRDRGDWGGLVILGRAKTNQINPEIEGITPAVIFGGDDDNDNSGIYKYLRVEFAGIELSPNNETNSITMGGVGSGTKMEYCQVSWGGDDGFEWFGGNVDGKYLISFGMWDDCFDIDFGYSGKVQFGLSVRYPSYADQSQSNGIEADSGPDNTTYSLKTTGVLSNLTIIGPIYARTQNSSGSWVNSGISSNYNCAADLRRDVAITVANSVLMGYPRGIRFNQLSVYNNYDNDTGKLLNNILIAPTNAFNAGSGVDASNVQTVWNKTAWGNTTLTGNDIPAQLQTLGIRSTNQFQSGMVRNQFPSNPNFALLPSGSLNSGAVFTDAKLNNTFFQQVAFRGAFGTSDWTQGWAEFNPVDKAY